MSNERGFGGVPVGSRDEMSDTFLRRMIDDQEAITAERALRRIEHEDSVIRELRTTGKSAEYGDDLRLICELVPQIVDPGLDPLLRGLLQRATSRLEGDFGALGMMRVYLAFDAGQTDQK